jgi:nicotinamide mononucleotide (NMN) deamidase PncC
MWHDHVLPRLRERGLGLDRASTTLHLTGIGESALVDVVGAGLLEDDNPRMATYARADFVDLRVSALATPEATAAALVAEAVAVVTPRVGPYLFARDDEGWLEALGQRLGPRTLAVGESGTAGYLGLLVGAAPWLRLAVARADASDAVALAAEVRGQAAADVGLAAVAHEAGDDMQVEIGLDIEGRTVSTTRTAFRGGDAGRRRSANAALAELWRQLAD